MNSIDKAKEFLGDLFDKLNEEEKKKVLESVNKQIEHQKSNKNITVEDYIKQNKSY